MYSETCSEKVLSQSGSIRWSFEWSESVGRCRYYTASPRKMLKVVDADGAGKGELKILHAQNTKLRLYNFSNKERI